MRFTATSTREGDLGGTTTPEKLLCNDDEGKKEIDTEEEKVPRTRGQTKNLQSQVISRQVSE